MNCKICGLLLFSMFSFNTSFNNDINHNLLSLPKAYCCETDTEDYYPESDDVYESVYDRLDIDSIDRDLSKSGVTLPVSVKEMIEDIAKDDTKRAGDKIRFIIKETLLGEIDSNRKLMMLLISVVLIGSIFVNLSGSMGNGFIGENGFYITYLIITSIMLSSFMVTLDMVSDTIRVVINLIKIIIPVYAMAIGFVGHASSAASMYAIIMLGIWLTESVILNLIIPMIRFYVVVSLINNLNKEDYFSKMCKLAESIVNWVLKTVVFFIAGLNIIKSLIEPNIDLLGRNAVNRFVSALPSGSMLSVLTGTFLGAGIVVKNSIGTAGIIIIGMVAAVPVIKTLFIMLIVRLTAVVLQPIGEKRYIEGLEGLARGIRLLLLCLISSVVLFVLTIAIMAYATNSGI